MNSVNLFNELNRIYSFIKRIHIFKPKLINLNWIRLNKQILIQITHPTSTSLFLNVNTIRFKFFITCEQGEIQIQSEHQNLRLEPRLGSE